MKKKMVGYLIAAGTIIAGCVAAHFIYKAYQDYRMQKDIENIAAKMDEVFKNALIWLPNDGYGEYRELIHQRQDVFNRIYTLVAMDEDVILAAKASLKCINDVIDKVINSDVDAAVFNNNYYSLVESIDETWDVLNEWETV
jgi:hypothetical protein